MMATVQSGYFGDQLKAKRIAAEITVPQMAARLQVDESTVRRWESGNRECREPLLTMYLAACGVSATEIELFKVRNSSVTDAVWGTVGATTDRESVFGALVRAEYRARKVTIMASGSIPAAFQTSGYATFVMERGGRVPEDQIAARVAERMGRAVMVRERTVPLEFDILIDESVLLRPIDSAASTLAQIKYLAECAQLPQNNIQVLPIGAGWTTMQHGQFSIYDFPEDPAVAYQELHDVMIFFNDPKDVEETYRANIERVRPLAMSREESRGLMLREIEKLEKLV